MAQTDLFIGVGRQLAFPPPDHQQSRLSNDNCASPTMMNKLCLPGYRRYRHWLSFNYSKANLPFVVLGASCIGSWGRIRVRSHSFNLRTRYCLRECLRWLLCRTYVQPIYHRVGNVQYFFWGRNRIFPIDYLILATRPVVCIATNPLLANTKYFKCLPIHQKS